MSRLRSGSLRCLLAAVVAVVLLPRSATGQAVTGTISGTVVDPQGQVIPGATVTVINEATNDARLAVTDARGNFQVTNLQPAGTRSRSRSRASARSSARTSCSAPASGWRSRNLALEVGSVGETVTVEARGTHVNTAETQHSGVDHRRRRSSRSRSSAATSRRSCGCCPASATRTPSTRWA